MSAIHLNRRMLALGLAGVLAVGAAGAVFAQAPGSSTPPGQGQGADAGQHRPGPRVGLKELAKASGLPEQTFVDGFKAGKSVNQILAASGKTPATVQAAVLADIKARLDKAVTDGKLTREKADAAYAKAREALPKLFDRTPDPTARRGGQHGRPVVHAVRGMLGAAANAIGVPPRDLATAMRNGQTPAQVAAAHNVRPESVVSTIVAQGNARIDKLIADGKLDPAKAAELKTKLAEHAMKFVNEGLPKRGPRNP